MIDNQGTFVINTDHQQEYEYQKLQRAYDEGELSDEEYMDELFDLDDKWERSNSYDSFSEGVDEDFLQCYDDLDIVENMVEEHYYG